MREITIRTATVSDAPAILDIYGYYVANTAISMEYDVPTLAEFEKRVETTLENYPYLVAEQEEKIRSIREKEKLIAGQKYPSLEEHMQFVENFEMETLL